MQSARNNPSSVLHRGRDSRLLPCCYPMFCLHHRLTLVPAVLDTRVLPTFLVLKTLGALMSYQSFLLKGSTLQKGKEGGVRVRRVPALGVFEKESCDAPSQGRILYSRLLLASLLSLGQSCTIKTCNSLQSQHYPSHQSPYTHPSPR